MTVLNFEGFIKDVQYRAFLSDKLQSYSYKEFNINDSSTFGKIVFPDGEIAFSKWVSPKRTRSYPFERLYNTFNSPMRLTIIPILKDEGIDGDLDRIQYSTISWMNLLNIYIVLSYYEKAIKNTRPLQVSKNKLTNQKHNEESVNAQISRISQYKQSALHWNRSLVDDSFVDIYRKALDSYHNISEKTGVKIHNRQTQEQYLATVMREFTNFRDISLRGSKSASLRETMTDHQLEYLADGTKATFEITNYLGGTYYLTADEVVYDETDDEFIIQESKNSSKGFLPSLSDIKDGLFKLILYSNLHYLKLDSKSVNFKTRLKLTGKRIQGTLLLPCDEKSYNQFLQTNQGYFSRKEVEILRRLNLEASSNNKLEILIASN